MADAESQTRENLTQPFAKKFSVVLNRVKRVTMAAGMENVMAAGCTREKTGTKMERFVEQLENPENVLNFDHV